MNEKVETAGKLLVQHLDVASFQIKNDLEMLLGEAFDAGYNTGRETSELD